MSAVPGVPRLPVRARLLAIFLLVGVLPLVIMATLTISRAHRMLDADRATANALVHNMGVSIVFLLAVGLVTAVDQLIERREIDRLVIAEAPSRIAGRPRTTNKNPPGRSRAGRWCQCRSIRTRAPGWGHAAARTPSPSVQG